MSTVVAGGGDVAPLDAGALADPGVAGIHAPFQVGVVTTCCGR
jgi:hypothetical protein